MKINESFAVEATEEVRKDPRFEWYVNWLKSLENKQWWDCYNSNSEGEQSFGIGISPKVYTCGNFEISCFDKKLTLDEVYSRYGKEIYEANGIVQPKEDCNILGYFFNGKLYKTLNELRGRTMSEDNKPIPLYAKEPFQGSREYDEQLLWDWFNAPFFASHISPNGAIQQFLNNRYPNESILKQITEHKAKIEELKKQLR